MTKSTTKDLRPRGDADPRPGSGQTHAEYQERKAERAERQRMRDDMAERAAKARKAPSPVAKAKLDAKPVKRILGPTTASKAALAAMREAELLDVANARKVATFEKNKRAGRANAPLGPDDGTPEWRARWVARGEAEAKVHREKRRPVSVRMGDGMLDAITKALFETRKQGKVLYLRSDFITAAVLALLADEPANIDHWLKKAVSA